MKRGQFLAVCSIVGLSLGWFAGSMLLGCGAIANGVGGLVGTDGTVYRCDVGVELELCWRGAEAELAIDLEALYGEPSVPCERSTRPATLFGCFYECPPPAHGCNAVDGCFCPPP